VQNHPGVEDRLAAARVAAMFKVSRPAYFASIANAALLLLVLWTALPAALLLGWSALLVALTLARIALQRTYTRGAGARSPRAWETRFVAGAVAAGLLWAAPPAFFLPEGDPLLQMAVVFVVGGTIIGASGVYAASPAAFYGFSALPFLAVVLQLALQPGRAYGLLALMVAVFGLVMLRVYRDLHGSVVSTLRTRIENEDLVARLAQSEGQLRDAIESFPEGIAVYDADDRLVVCNEHYARVYGAGKGAAELPGTPYPLIAQNALEAELLPPEYEDRRTQWLEEHLARRRSGGTGKPRYLQLRDGRSLQGLYVRSRAGGMVSVFTDVTELRRTQDAYGRVLEQEKVMLDTLPVGVAFLAERVIVRCNRRLEEMLGYGPGELAGQSSRVLYPTEALWREAGERYQLMRGGQVLEGEFKLRRKDGSLLWCGAVGRALDPEAPQASIILAYSDISQRHASERALRKSEAMYRNLVETSNDLVWSLDAQGCWTYLSPAATRRIYGSAPGDLLGRSLREMLAPEVSARDQAVFRRILEGESVFDYQTRHQRRDGSHVDLSFNAVPLRDGRGAVVGATGTARDVTAEKAAAAEQYENVEKLRLAVGAAELEYWEWDRASGSMRFGEVPGASQPGAKRIGFDSWLQRVHEDDRERCRAASLATQQRGEPFEIDFRVHDGSGEVRWMHSRGKAILDAGGRIARVIGVSQDITERKRREEEARFLAYHDTLTGLPNRRLLDDRLRQAVFLAHRRDARVAAMVIDLDRFKQVNDALGHRAGDTVLREAAHRIAGCVRKADTLARHGGDEFVVVIPDLTEDADCQVVAEKILRALEPPFLVDGRAFAIGASIGISLCPTDAGDGEGVLRNADAAMYRAKELGRNNYRFYGR
jgi:diguanylate cyclase (GGDEF)-like protein/PAS domain S-box-containing protein